MTALLDTDFIGQDQLCEQLVTLVDCAKARGEVAEHILLTGPGGLGKSRLAQLMAERMGGDYRYVLAGAVNTLRDMADFLCELTDGAVVCIDEVHDLSKKVVAQLLYTAMADFRISVRGKGGPQTHKLPRFTLVAATTDPQKLTESFIGRFGVQGNVRFYSLPELVELIKRGAESKLFGISDDAALDLARRAWSTPREALRLLRRAIDQATGQEVITLAHVGKAMALEGIDSVGLTELDLDVLRALAVHFAGRAVGIDPLRRYMGQPINASDTRLSRSGMVEQTDRGRVCTDDGYRHLGLMVPIRVRR